MKELDCRELVLGSPRASRKMALEQRTMEQPVLAAKIPYGQSLAEGELRPEQVLCWVLESLRAWKKTRPVEARS